MVEQYDHMKCADTLAITPAEMEWLSSQQEVHRDIKIFGIPPLAIGESMPYDEFLQKYRGFGPKETTDITEYLKKFASAPTEKEQVDRQDGTIDFTVNVDFESLLDGVCKITSVFGTPSASSISYEEVKDLKEELKLHESNQPIYDWTTVSRSYTDMHSWYVSVETYNRIRYLFHLSSIRPVFTRKIRKCHMRKAVQRYQREKKRAQRRYGV